MQASVACPPPLFFSSPCVAWVPSLQVSVGASGALFGLVGASLSELLTNWSMYSNRVGEHLNTKLFSVSALMTRAREKWKRAVWYGGGSKSQCS